MPAAANIRFLQEKKQLNPSDACWNSGAVSEYGYVTYKYTTTFSVGRWVCGHVENRLLRGGPATLPASILQIFYELNLMHFMATYRIPDAAP